MEKDDISHAPGSNSTGLFLSLKTKILEGQATVSGPTGPTLLHGTILVLALTMLLIAVSALIAIVKFG